MTTSALLAEQTKSSFEWVRKIAGTIPPEKWDVFPDTVETTVSWQMGHLVVSYYFHTIWVIRGHAMDILQAVPMKEYGELFTNGAPQAVIGKTTPQDLLKHLEIVEQKSLGIIVSLTEDELESPLEPTPVPHPIAQTKRAAIEWNLQHTMYHCGQIALLKRVIDQRFDFRLKL